MARDYHGKGEQGIADAIEFYTDEGYLPLPNAGNVWYLPSDNIYEEHEPHNCPCVSIWLDAEGRAVSEEY